MTSLKRARAGVCVYVQVHARVSMLACVECVYARVRASFSVCVCACVRACVPARKSVCALAWVIKRRMCIRTCVRWVLVLVY